MQWFVDLFMFFFENIHFFVIGFTIIALILCYYVVSIELKARYYLAIKKRMNELEND